MLSEIGEENKITEWFLDSTKLYFLQSSIDCAMKLLQDGKAIWSNANQKEKEPKMRDWTKVVELMCLRLFLLKIG